MMVEDAIGFEAADALNETKAMWLKIGRYLADFATSTDWIDSPREAQIAMEMAARAEACLWRATGDEDCANAGAWLPELTRRGIEARQGGASLSGSIHENPCGEADAPAPGNQAGYEITPIVKRGEG